MINYFDWPKRKISTTSLRLDYQNPRLTQFNKKPTQPEIIEYLIKNEKVLDLAKSIATQGYFLNEQPIVCKEDNKFVVLEGNRRVAACKILINPDLIKSKVSRTSLLKYLKNFNINIVAKLEVIISPSRKASDTMIVNRHTGGSVVEKWDLTKQDRFLHNRFIAGESIEEMATMFSLAKNEIKRSLQRYNLFGEILKLPLDNKIKDLLREEVKFNMTNVERVYDSRYGREFLGIEFNDTGQLLRKLPPAEFQKRLKKIVEKVIDGTINSRTLNKEEEDKKPFFEKLLKSSEFNSSIKLDIKNNDDYIEDIPEPVKPEGGKGNWPKKAPASNQKLMSRNISFVTGTKRIDDIFEELKRLNLKYHSNAIAVLLRSYIDMVTYQFLKKNNGLSELLKLEGEKIKNDNAKKIASAKVFLTDLGFDENLIDDAKFLKALKLSGNLKKDFIPSLRFMLDYLAKSELLTEAKIKHSLQSYLAKDSKVDKILGHNEFNLLVHNEYYTNDAEELKLAWNKLEPILHFMVTEITQTL